MCHLDICFVRLKQVKLVGGEDGRDGGIKFGKCETVFIISLPISYLPSQRRSKMGGPRT